MRVRKIRMTNDMKIQMASTIPIRTQMRGIQTNQWQAVSAYQIQLPHFPHVNVLVVCRNHCVYLDHIGPLFDDYCHDSDPGLSNYSGSLCADLLDRGAHFFLRTAYSVPAQCWLL